MDKTLLKKLRQEINREIKLNLKHCGIPVSFQMMGYQVGLLKTDSEEAQGKRFRPTLCLLSSLAISGDYKKALPAAAAIELIHNFSLIHDDIQDEDKYRRGRMTVWKKWDNSQAINAGDAMHALANLALLRLFKTNLDLKVINSVFSAVNHACFQMCEGQMLDIDFEKREDVKLPAYLRMIQKKTAALIECAPVAGALIAGASRKVIECYRNFGFNAGMAFQIFNDLSGLNGSVHRLDHPRLHGDSPTQRMFHFCSDLIKKKKTLPIILALQGLEHRQKKNMKISRMLNLIRQSNAVQSSRRIGEEYLEKALAELCRAGIRNPAQELLKEYVLNIKR